MSVTASGPSGANDVKPVGGPGPDAVVWLVAAIVVAASIVLRERLSWISEYPSDWTLPFSAWINIVMDWLVEHGRWLFRGIAWLMGWPMSWIQSLLEALPWTTSIAIAAGLAYYSGGLRLALFTIAALIYIAATGYWLPSMNTLVLVFMSIPLSAGVGLFVGIWVYRSRWVEMMVKPVLDAMQTVPCFAYLIPILVLFGFGPQVAIIATAIYACPPMVRNVAFGLRHVPAEVVESGVMSGATKRQLMWMVQIPSAMPSVLLGLNQVVMQTLNMVIIAAVIGSTRDIGWEVLYALRKAWFGQSLMSGLVVVLLAIILDRVTRGIAARRQRMRQVSATGLARVRSLWVALVVAVVFLALSWVIPFFAAYPEAWYFKPGDTINKALTNFTVDYANAMEAIKRTVVFFFLFPLKLGLETTIRPFTWGFELTPTVISVYALAVAAAIAFSARRWGWRAGASVAALGSLLYFGIVNMPWPAFVAIVAVAAYSIGGARIAVFTVLGFAFMLVAGIWTPAIGSIYLCSAAVLAALSFGSVLGTVAAHNDAISRLLRPIVDTLQTLPLFVFLIPILMFFQVGEFPAFLAITAYAVVASIRYTEHGLRNVPEQCIEAAQAIGCTSAQVFWQVRLPLALPVVMLGLNQTIMFALAMLAISALVGSTELGQEIYIALSNADTGQGIVAAIGIVTIAMVSDRTIQAWSARRKALLGLR